MSSGLVVLFYEWVARCLFNHLFLGVITCVVRMISMTNIEEVEFTCSGRCFARSHSLSCGAVNRFYVNDPQGG